MSHLQAVVLAGGKGNRLELVGDDYFNIGDDWQSALLPLAGIPLFWYPLNVLAKNKITDVLLITNAACVDQINELLGDGSLPELPGLNIEIVATPCGDSEEFEDFGSAEALQMFADRIKRDFILLTGYFVSDIALQDMVKMHYDKSSILTCLLSDKASHAAPPGPKDQQSYKDFIGLCEDSDQILYLQSEEELELDLGKSTIAIKDSIDFSKANSVEFTSAYMDCHVYVMDYRILDLLNFFVSETESSSHERDFSSIKADLIPSLLDEQNKQDDQGLLAFFKRSSLQSTAYALQYGVDAEQPSLFRMFGYKATSDVSTIIGKCNTLGSYLETNKAMLELKKPFLPLFAETPKYPGTRIIIVKSRIDASTTIGDNGISIVKSSIGKECEVANTVKVEESVVMAGVIIGSGCQIKRCIIGRGAKIGPNCKLENCVIDAEHFVEPKTNAKDTFLHSEEEWEL